MSDSTDSVLLEIKGLMLDPSSKTPIVLLHDVTGDTFLPIWIGVFEANAIALSIEGIQPPRPMTHDLLFTACALLGAEVEKVTICDLKGSTFYAMIFLRGPGGEHVLDARPSDAIALALRAEAPIYAHRSVLDGAQSSEFNSQLTDDERLKKWLEEARDEDFGDYEM
jgi:bifunctional DNase/RNase